MISHGGFGIFLERPVSLVFLVATLGFLLLPLLRYTVRSLGHRAAAV
jgi:TctA family transporter